MKPILFHLFGEPVFSYPLLMGFGWGVGFNYSALLWKRQGLANKKLWQLFIGSFIFGWIGAKVFFLIFSAPDMALNYGREVNFWLGGGFVFYGGLVFAALFSLLFIRLNMNSKYELLGLITPGLAIGHAIGRVGCFLAGCCYGDHCDLPIGVLVKGISRHPVQLYEVAGLVLIFLILRKLVLKKELKESLLLYPIGYSLLRFALEFFRGDAIRGLYAGLSTSQWVSILIVLVSSIIFLKNSSSRS